MKKNNGKNTAIAFKNLCLTLTMLFTSLRACDVTDWSWYWVVSPLFLLYGVELIALIFLGAVKVNESSEEGEVDENNDKS